MSDFLESFFSNVNSRMSNPLFGAFIISWGAWNWKIIVILLSSNLNTHEKLTEVEGVLECNFYIIHTLIIPLILALIMYLAIPRAYRYLEKNYNNEVEKERYENSNDRLLAAQNASSISAMTKDLKVAQDALMAEREAKRVVDDEFRIFKQETATSSNAVINQHRELMRKKDVAHNKILEKNRTDLQANISKNQKDYNAALADEAEKYTNKLLKNNKVITSLQKQNEGQIQISNELMKENNLSKAQLQEIRKIYSNLSDEIHMAIQTKAKKFSILMGTSPNAMEDGPTNAGK